MRKHLFIPVLLIISLFVSGCADFNGSSGKDYNNSNLVQLRLSVKTEKTKLFRTLIPQGLQESDITRAVLKSVFIDDSGNEAGAELIIKEWNKSSSPVLFQIRSDDQLFISQGKYKFTLLLYALQDTSEVLCQKGEVIYNVEAGVAAAIAFNCKYENASTGKFKVTIKWQDTDSERGVKSVLAGLYTGESIGEIPAEGFALEQVPIEDDGSSIIYEKQFVPCGIYFIRCELFDNVNPYLGTKLNTLEEIVYVYAACETTGNLMIQNLNKQYSITYEMNGGSWASGFTPVTQRNVNQSVLLPDETNITKSGRIFAGWYTSPDFTESAVTSINYGTVEDVTLHARWFCPTLYVSESGLDHNNGETSGKALASVSRAIDILNSGAEASGHLTEDLTIYVSGRVKGSTSIATINGARLCIEGASAESDSLDGENVSDVLSVVSSVPLEISKLNITNSTGSGAGGTGALNIGAPATVTLKECKVSGNTSSQNGAGIYSMGKVYLEDTVISDNSAGANGGGLYLGNGAELYMYGSSVIGNASASSHALSTEGNYSNFAGGHGGGIYCDGAKIYMGYKNSSQTDDSFSGGICWNYSGDNGGAVYLAGTSELHIASGSINYNAAANDGGAIRCVGTDATEITGDADIKENYAGRRGGAFFIGGSSSVSISAGTLSLNEAGTSGGAVFLNGSGSAYGKLILSGSASLPSGAGGGNDVYLPKDSSILTSDLATISVGSFTSGSSVKVAKITLPDESGSSMYQVLTKVLSGSTDNAVTNAANVAVAYSKFDLTQPSDGLTWKIISTGTIVTGASVTPVISFAETFSDINVTFNYSTNTFTADSGYSNYEWYVNNVKKNTTSSSTFTVDTTGLSTGVYDIRMECTKGTEYYSFYGQLTVN